MKTLPARLAGAVLLILLMQPALRAQTGSGTTAAVPNDPGIMMAGRKLPPDVFDPRGKPAVVIFASRDMADWFYVDVFKQAAIIDDNFRKAGVNTLFYYANYFQEGIPRALGDRSSQFKFPIQTMRMDDATARWGLKATPLMVVIDPQGVIRKVQAGWTGVDDHSQGSLWLVKVAAAALDTMGVKAPGIMVAASKPAPASAAPGNAGNASLPAGTYEGDVVFTFSDQSRLISHRTVLVTNDPTLIGLNCTEYYANDKSKMYSSKLVMKGGMKGNVFYSTEQQTISTDYKEWLSEYIQLEFAPDGKSATLISSYKNSTGVVTGSGVLQRKN